jgi:hypothetical protein
VVVEVGCRFKIAFESGAEQILAVALLEKQSYFEKWIAEYGADKIF